MNKATLISIINEELAGVFKKSGEEWKVYKNPTMKDWNELALSQNTLTFDKPYLSLNPKICRFIIDTKTKDVYVHSAGILHTSAAKAIGIEGYNDKVFSVRFFSGTAKLDGGRMTIIGNDMFEFFDFDEKLSKKMRSVDLSFAQKFFDTDLNKWVDDYAKKGKSSGVAINIRDMKV